MQKKRRTGSSLALTDSHTLTLNSSCACAVDIFCKIGFSDGSAPSAHDILVVYPPNCRKSRCSSACSRACHSASQQPTDLASHIAAHGFFGHLHDNISRYECFALLMVSPRTIMTSFSRNSKNASLVRQ